MELKSLKSGGVGHIVGYVCLEQRKAIWNRDIN